MEERVVYKRFNKGKGVERGLEEGRGKGEVRERRRLLVVTSLKKNLLLKNQLKKYQNLHL